MKELTKLAEGPHEVMICPKNHLQVRAHHEGRIHCIQHVHPTGPCGRNLRYLTAAEQALYLLEGRQALEVVCETCCTTDLTNSTGHLIRCRAPRP